MDAKEKVLATMKEAGQPLNAGKIAELAVGAHRDDAAERTNHAAKHPAELVHVREEPSGERERNRRQGHRCRNMSKPDLQRLLDDALL